MPQRFLKPGLISSPKWDSLPWITQSFYVRILTLVDDFGRYEANPALLRSMAFPLREDIRTSQITNLCNELADSQLAIFYKANGREYLQLTNWTETPRAERSKYPNIDPSCEQMFANVCKPPRDENKCSPSSSSSSSSSFALKVEQPFAENPLGVKRKNTMVISETEWWEKLKTKFPGIDLELQKRRAEAWLLNHPQRKFTRKFFINWLLRIDPPIGGSNSDEPPTIYNAI